MLLYHWIDILGTASFAISGTMVAYKKRLDLFGILIIAFVTSIGGGTVRDILLGSKPVGWLLSIETSLIIIISSVFALIFRKKLTYLSRSIFLFDTLGIGFFTLIGIDKALEAGIHPLLCIGLGTVSACFGGVTRDILCNEIPVIFRKEIYATACFLGGVTYFLFKEIRGIDHDFVTIASIMVVIIIRLYAVIFNKSLPNLYKNETE